MTDGAGTMPSSIAFAESLPGILMTGGAAILTLLTLLNLRGRIARRRNTGAESPRDLIDRVRAEAGDRSGGRGADYQPHITAGHESLVELDHAARRIIAQIDSRAARLEKLIDRADERLRRLEEVGVDQRMGASISPPARAPAPTTNEIRAPRRIPAARASHPCEVDERDLKLNSHSTPPPPRLNGSTQAASDAEVRSDRDRRRNAPRSSHWRDPVDPLSASVYELADRGRTPIEIARTLDEQVGKVELILALRTCAASSAGATHLDQL